MDLLFYDGSCGLCHRTVLWALRHDPDGSRFRFAPIGGETYLATFAASTRATLPDSIVLRSADGRVLVRSDAVLRVGERVEGGWGLLARWIGIVPRWLLDRIYDIIARVRRQLFAPPAGACPIVPRELRPRFLP
jgi:predicted DCC family thiol-disulfide oxidoreductase YuxK